MASHGQLEKTSLLIKVMPFGRTNVTDCEAEMLRTGPIQGQQEREGGGDMKTKVPLVPFCEFLLHNRIR